MAKPIAELATPRTGQGMLDEAAMVAAIETRLRQGDDTLMILGAFGQQGHATASEQEALVSLCAHTIQNRARLMVGVFETASARAIERIAAYANADTMGFVVTPSFHFGLSNPQELASHFSVIRSATQAPLFYMHFPALTRVQPDAAGWHLLKDTGAVSGAMILEDSLLRRDKILADLGAQSLPCWLPSPKGIHGAACAWEVFGNA